MSNVNEDLKLCQQGYVYVILDNHGRVKIGKSLNPQKRIQNIASSSGITIEDAFITEPLFWYSELELYLHDKFSEYRCIGEWFSCKFNDVISFIKSIDMSDFNQERYMDLSGVNALAGHLRENTKRILKSKEDGLIDPLVDVIEYIVGIGDKSKETLYYRASPESHKRIEDAITKQSEFISKFTYLLNKCRALEELNDCYYEEMYINSEILSRLENTVEIDNVSNDYKDIKLNLLARENELLKNVMNSYITSEIILKAV